jgi:hypothetical protein
VPEPQQRGTTEHEHYEALCALAVGGLLEGEELVDSQAHLKDCGECRSDYLDLSRLITLELPQAQGAFQQKLAEMRTNPLPGSRQSFLRRARAEGVVFSPEVETPARSGPWYLRPIAGLIFVAALIVIAVSLKVHHVEAPDTARAKDAAVTQNIAELERANSELTANLSKLKQSLAMDQHEIQNLRSQLGNAATTAENLRRNGEQSSSHTVQLLDESRNQEKLLAEARDEAARSSQLRINDEASLVEQQARITELSNKLRIASATVDQERQLAAAGKDVQELMASRQLHVIDVRDTDPNGDPGKAFGRVFLTEGKLLTFYAFDLNEGSVLNTKRGFQVWAVPETAKDSPHSLGFLHVDAKAQGRWVLTVEKPELLKQIGAVFVTAEPTDGDKQPTGQKMLYAYLGEANHR